MINEYNIFHKSTTSSSSSYYDERKTETIKPTNDNLRQHSQRRFINKISRITLNLVSSNQDKRKSDNINNTEQDVLEEKEKENKTNSNLAIYNRSILSESEVDHKLKGILKNEIKSRSNSFPIIGLKADPNDFKPEKIYWGPCLGVDNLSNNKGNSTSCDLSTIPDYPSPLKHVTFSDKISKTKYQPDRPVSSIKKSLQRQQAKLQSLQEKDSLNIQSNNEDDSSSTNASETNFSEKNSITTKSSLVVTSWDSSEDEGIDDE